jgi:hypothetical protein
VADNIKKLKTFRAESGRNVREMLEKGRLTQCRH